MRVLKYFSGFVILLAVTTACIRKNKSETPPNIIIILTDDQGYKDVGFNGSKDIKTPHIDRIAKNGVVFSNGYVSYAVCGPSRAGLITGRYQDRFGFSRNPLFAPKDSTQGLPVSEENLAEALKRGGYTSMAVGKWHLGAHPTLRPLQRGFDQFFGFLTGGHKYFPENWTKQDISEVTAQWDAYNTKLLKNNKRIEETEYLTDALSREAVTFIKENKKKPFFLYLAYNAPHTPLQATEKYLARNTHIKDKKRRTYAAMISAVDDGVGSVLDELTKQNINENTIVFFLSDNGGPETKNSSNNGPLRDGKGSMHEGGIRVPFAVQWPGVIPAGNIYENPVISLDIFATAIAQTSITPKNSLDGKDLIKHLTNPNLPGPHQTLFWRNYDKQTFAIRKDTYKYVQDGTDKIGLYDLSKDIAEQYPLKADSIRQNLLETHQQWNNANPMPAFLGLRQNRAYNKKYPKRYHDLEKY